MKIRILLAIVALSLFAGCGAGNTPSPAANTSASVAAPVNQPAVKDKQSQGKSPEAERSVTVWIVVDGMTKVQGIT
jgi:hypothetical protein